MVTTAKRSFGTLCMMGRNAKLRFKRHSNGYELLQAFHNKETVGARCSCKARSSPHDAPSLWTKGAYMFTKDHFLLFDSRGTRVLWAKDPFVCWADLALVDFGSCFEALVNVDHGWK